MAAINPSNSLSFVSSKEIFATLKAELESLDAMGVINTQKLYRHLRLLITRLGVSVYEEYNGVIDIDSAYKGELPDNFSILHAGFRLDPITRNSNLDMNLGKFTYYIEETCSTIERSCNLTVPPVITPQSRIEYQTKVRGYEDTRSWNNARLMRLSTRTPKEFYTDSCQNIGCGSADEFAIDYDSGKIWTNFRDSSLLLQYYGFPVDENNLPKIPNDPVYYDAIFTHLRFKLFEELFYNGTVQDIQNRYQKAEIDAAKAFKEATYRSKLFSFSEAITSVQKNRHRFAPYQL